MCLLSNVPRWHSDFKDVKMMGSNCFFFFFFLIKKLAKIPSIFKMLRDTIPARTTNSFFFSKWFINVRFTSARTFRFFFLHGTSVSPLKGCPSTTSKMEGINSLFQLRTCKRERDRLLTMMCSYTFRLRSYGGITLLYETARHACVPHNRTCRAKINKNK